MRSRRYSSLLVLVLVAVSLVVLRAAQAPSRPSPSTAKPDAIRLNNLGVASMNQQKFDPALQRFEEAVAADPAFVTARVNQAIALASLQRYEPAREILQKVVEEDPGHARALYNLGLLQKSTGDTEASLAAFERAAAARPTDAHAQYFIGLMAGQAQQYDKAIAAFKKALELDPFLVSAEFGLARAYQRGGRGEEAKAHLERFQRLTTEKIASAMSLAYGDQGPLSLAEAVLPTGSAAPRPVKVAFVAGAATPFATSKASPQPGASLGVGGCVLDFDADGVLDFLALNPHAGTGDAVTLFRGTGGAAFAPVAASGLAVKGQPIGCAAADVDNDEKVDVAISLQAGQVVLFRNEGGRFVDVTEKSGLTSRAGGTAVGLTFVDYDHDTDADLLVARAAAIDDRGAVSADPANAAATRMLVFRNNGNGTFAEVGEERGLTGRGPTIAIVGTDFNNDRAIDLVATGGPQPLVYINPREGAFTALEWPAPAAATVGVVVLDYDKDGWMDLAFTHAGAPGLSLWRNTQGKGVEPAPLPSLPVERGWGLAAVDYDNDGWTDLVAAGGPAAGSGGLLVLRNEQGRFADATAAVGAAAVPLTTPRGVLTADVDADGDSDLVITSAGEAPRLVRNEGGNANHSIRLTLKGLNDNRSGIGTKVEVQAGAIWQKLETVSASGFLGQSAPELVVGIGQEKEVDVVRLLWPTGVVQDEVQLAAAKPATIEQVDRRGSSCPVVFTWNGQAYEFITDAIGPAVVGHWVAPETRNVPDPNEYIRIDGRQLVARNGRLSVKFVEPMEEVIYLDQAKLIAVDHPEGTDIFPNEYFAAIAPQPSARVFGVRDARPPAGAWDGDGRDVLPQLRTRDQRYVDGFPSAPFKGFAELHALELDLGDLPAGAPVRLIMSGFTDYFTATSVFAAHQADVTAIVPWLEAQLPDGTWKKVSDDIGFPAGLRRTMTADLAGKLPPGARRVRIWTNLKIYWDQVLVDTTPDDAVEMRRTEAPLASASLAFRGFPRETTGTPAADLTYIYDEVSRFGPWARHRGFYTRYGDVHPLVGAIDDRFAIFGAGEEVSLEFDATALPRLPGGWTRTYLFYVHGYVKDMDFYAAHAQTVTPLPFAAMGSYPYPSDTQYPQRNQSYLLDWNTRQVESEAWPSYKARYSAADGSEGSR
jgi:tetratricopeptide (TPR) repeat protein